ncbi:hypothetical protein KMW28_23265 [Flammeovirga yaeyamensis]|uniref:S1 motif domain-containing protein n=1 Tax=Flammeovirga yaeyamensis TaxID=367791 RepID=A0AAX1NCV5_9BACT|nr:hypothetical protein [Flammeovirga yaeyamensis]MBB3696711.1 ribosomal protein S1 [Flammeovirga yaeyamensis]NMF33382.1 hypothetical protein [Flammeovirga yaeyamensis]QWG05344.1 hypothetical protein KMW28_23265 [Flammeovirga yaeyamensis]
MNNKWERIKRKYPIGGIVRGEIIKHTVFGVFIDVKDEDLQGFIPIIDFGMEYYDKFHLNNDKGNHNIINDTTPSFYPEIGFEMPFKVTGYNNNSFENKWELWLSIKVNKMPRIDWDLTKRKYPKGSKVFGSVIRHTNLGVYVNINDDPLEGFIPSFCFGKKDPFKNYPSIGSQGVFNVMNYSIDIEGHEEKNQIFLK